MRNCSICRHDDRREIDLAILRGTPLRTTADRYRVDYDCLQRHKSNRHHGTAVARTVKLERENTTDGLLRELDRLQTSNEHIRKRALKTADLYNAIQANAAINNNLRLRAEILKLVQNTTVINLTAVPGWNDISAILYDLMEEFPPVRARLLERLDVIEALPEKAS
jgi:hypothetical protein